jgi:hypothetical protein
MLVVGHKPLAGLEVVNLYGLNYLAHRLPPYLYQSLVKSRNRCPLAPVVQFAQLAGRIPLYLKLDTLVCYALLAYSSHDINCVFV